MPYDQQNDIPDEALLVLFANGDGSAARMLTLRLTPRAFGHAFRVLGDRGEAEDVAQEAMIRLFKIAIVDDHTDNHVDDRPLKSALAKGWRRKCPNCGDGPLLKGYLKVRDHCTVCKQELHHQRADDGPAYLTILVVGHLMAPLLHIVFVTWRPEPLTLFTIFTVGCVALSLYLLPRFKGGMVAFQWARRMNGF